MSDLIGASALYHSCPFLLITGFCKLERTSSAEYPNYHRYIKAIKAGFLQDHLSGDQIIIEAYNTKKCRICSTSGPILHSASNSAFLLYLVPFWLYNSMKMCKYKSYVISIKRFPFELK
jgi:hypothetical protein